MLPQIRYGKGKTRRDILKWGGIHYGAAAADGDLTDSENLSARHYPALSPREARTYLTGCTMPTAICGGNALAVVSGTDLMYDGAVVGTVTPGDKQMAVIAGKLLVFPDKVYYDTADGSFGSMTADVTVTADITDSTITAIDGTDLAAWFTPGQALELTGCTAAENNVTIVLRSAAGSTLSFYDNSFTPETGVALRIRRNIPDLTFLCAQGNRLWGVDDTTIYASALGDGLTFYNYDGLSTDAYALSLGTSGQFTGIAPYGSNVLVFEENRMHKVLGSIPSEYTVYSYTVPGVQPGCHKSLAVVNEVLYYKGTDGIYAYSGGAPVSVGGRFGVRRFTDACGGAAGHKYYLSMIDALTKAAGLYVLDTRTGVWLREDDSRCLGFAKVGSDLYILSDKGIFTPEQGEDADVAWTALLAPFDRTTPEGRRYTKLYIQADMQPNAWIRVEVRFDEGRWQSVGTYRCYDRRGIVIPVLPNDCTRFQVRISGRGGCVLRQVTRDYVEGGLV